MDTFSRLQPRSLLFLPTVLFVLRCKCTVIIQLWMLCNMCSNESSADFLLVASSTFVCTTVTFTILHITPSRNAHCTYPCKTLGSCTENLYIFPVFTNNLLVVAIIDATIHVIVLSCCSITVLVFSNLMKDQEKKSLSLHCLQWCNSNSANPGKQRAALQGAKDYLPSVYF